VGGGTLSDGTIARCTCWRLLDFSGGKLRNQSLGLGSDGFSRAVRESAEETTGLGLTGEALGGGTKRLLAGRESFNRLVGDVRRNEKCASGTAQASTTMGGLF